MKRSFTACLLAGIFVLPAFAQSLTPGQQKYRALFQELVETNTQLSNGDCTALARKIAGHLKEAGLPDSDIHVFTAPDHPKEGGIVAVLPGSDPNAKAVLLLGHLDVVEARREDWTRDPYKLIEENGYFFGRGVSDMKSLAADWIDTMMRLKQESFQHPRALKVALTCGEETASAFNGAGWLATHWRASLGCAEGPAVRNAVAAATVRVQRLVHPDRHYRRDSAMRRRWIESRSNGPRYRAIRSGDAGCLLRSGRTAYPANFYPRRRRRDHRFRRPA